MNVEEIIQRLNEGHIGVIATDTLFGLVAKARDREAVEKVYTIKKRHTKKPCIILLARLEQLEEFPIVLPERFKKFLAKIWPGPVTVILRLAEGEAREYHHLHRGTGEMTFRLPDNMYLQDIIKQVGPIIAPSANPEGKPPARTIDEIKNYFGEHVDIYLDDHDHPLENEPSTIIKIKEHKIYLIREGVVPFSKLEDIWISSLL